MGIPKMKILIRISIVLATSAVAMAGFAQDKAMHLASAQYDSQNATNSNAPQTAPAHLRYGFRENAPIEDDGSFYDTFIKGRLHIGLSYTKMSMDETSTPHEKAYLGNLDTLKEDDTGKAGITIKYDFCDYAAIMFAYDMSAKLSAWNNSSESTDGSLELDGYTLQAIGQYPWEAVEGKVTATPYVGLGFASFSADWSYAPWWHYGWGSPDAYSNAGNSSNEPHNGYSRWMIPEDPSAALTYSIGVVLQLYRHVDIDIFYRVVDLDDVKAKFRTYGTDGRVVKTGAFPASFSAFGIALKYVF